MKNKSLSIFWGVGLIAAGGLTLASNLGYLDSLSPIFWISVFTAISVLSFAAYFVTGVKNWGWLFPAGIFGALGLMITLAELGMRGAAIGAPLFIAIGIPFVVAYFLNRSANWWALIPTGVMAFLTFTILMVDSVAGEFIGSSLFFAIGLAFLLVFLSNRTRTWAALVAYILFVLGLMPLIALTPMPDLAGALFLFAAGLPFLAVAVASPQRWWALFPAGALTTLGLVTTANLFFDLSLGDNFYTALTLAGFSATFALVWLRSSRRWAGIIAVMIALMSVGSLLNIGIGFQLFLPLCVIAAGILLLASALRPRAA